MICVQVVVKRCVAWEIYGDDEDETVSVNKALPRVLFAPEALAFFFAPEAIALFLHRRRLLSCSVTADFACLV